MKHTYLFVLILLASCAPGVSSGNRSVIDFADVEPVVQNYLDPEADTSAYKTFTIIPMAGSEFAENRNALEEKQLFSSIVNRLTYSGYKYVPTTNKADFAVFITNYTNNYQTEYVPPESVTVPVWVPGQTITSTADASVYSGGQYGFGSVTQKTNMPGYMTTETYTSEGYTTGAFYPAVVLDLYDTRTRTQIYSGRAVWTSNIQDMRVAFPWVANLALSDFPTAQSSEACLLPLNRALGAVTLSATVDGNDYYPMIARFQKDHPVRYLGRQKLQTFDAIVNVDGVSLKNVLDSCQQRMMIAKSRAGNGIRALQVLRAGEIIEVAVELY